MMLVLKREILEEVTERNTKMNIQSMIQKKVILNLSLLVGFNGLEEEQIHIVEFLSK